MSILAARLPEETKVLLRQSLESQLEAARTTRLSFWQHWALCAEMFLPRRYRWFVTANQYSKGAPINQSIVDETGVLAARTLASGLLSGLTSPTKPWFKLGLHGIDLAEDTEGYKWLYDCASIMMRVFAQSNFYTSLGVAYHDMAVFGSAAMIQYEDFEDVIHFYNPCLGEFFFISDQRLVINGMFREYTYTVSQTIAEFGVENCPLELQIAARTGGGTKEKEVVICHAILQNKPVSYQFKDLGYTVPKTFPFYEIHWVKNSPKGDILRISPFKEKPFVGGRWDVTSNDPYGRSPGMDALPAVRQLQIEQRRKAEAIDKMVRPPMVGSVAMKNEPASILPGGVTYVTDPSANGFKPAFQVEPRIAELMEDLREVQARVNSVFFVDLFLMISQLDTVRTATEIDARREEKLIQLGPVIERFENEVLDPIVHRTFAICARKGLFPPPPESISGREIQVNYISMLAEAQSAASTAAIERVFAFAGNLVGVLPNIIDNLDGDEAIDVYAEKLKIPPEIIRATAVVAQIRQQRQAQEAQQQALASGAALAQGAKTLSETDVGGGQNALQRMVGI